MLHQSPYNVIRHEKKLVEEKLYTTDSWGQKVIRFYDPDGNLIEGGTPV